MAAENGLEFCAEIVHWSWNEKSAGRICGNFSDFDRRASVLSTLGRLDRSKGCTTKLNNRTRMATSKRDISSSLRLI